MLQVTDTLLIPPNQANNPNYNKPVLPCKPLPAILTALLCSDLQDFRIAPSAYDFPSTGLPTPPHVDSNDEFDEHPAEDRDHDHDDDHRHEGDKVSHTGPQVNNFQIVALDEQVGAPIHFKSSEIDSMPSARNRDKSSNFLPSSSLCTPNHAICLWHHWFLPTVTTHLSHLQRKHRLPSCMASSKTVVAACPTAACLAFHVWDAYKTPYINHSTPSRCSRVGLEGVNDHCRPATGTRFQDVLQRTHRFRHARDCYVRCSHQ